MFGDGVTSFDLPVKKDLVIGVHGGHIDDSLHKALLLFGTLNGIVELFGGKWKYNKEH
jgi:hypothetical protein